MEDYCVEGTFNETIILEGVIGETIEVTHKINEPGFLWEWIIETDPNKTVTIQLTRGATGSEELGLSYNSSGSVTFVSNKDMTNCAGTGYSLEINNTSQVTLRSIIQTNSTPVSYEFLVEQQGIDYGTPSVLTNNKTLVEYVALFLVIIFIFTLLSTLVFALCKRTGKISLSKLKRVEKYKKKIHKQKLPEIEEVMYNMQAGNFEDFEREYQYHSWSICKIKFEAGDQCHLTNECVHLFHSDWLKQWYEMVSDMSDLVCPQWNTKNFPGVEEHPEESDEKWVDFEDRIDSQSYYDAQAEVDYS